VTIAAFDFMMKENVYITILILDVKMRAVEVSGQRHTLDRMCFSAVKHVVRCQSVVYSGLLWRAVMLLFSATVAATSYDNFTQ